MKFPYREVALIGAGPVGLDLAYHLKQRRLSYYHFEQGPIGQTLLELSPEETIGSPGEIAVASVPLAKQSSVSRNAYLAYLRRVVEKRQLPVQTFEHVCTIQRMGDLWHIRTSGYDDVCHQYRAKYIVFATGNRGRRQADPFPGSDSPLRHERPRDPHFYFQRRVLIVGSGADAQSAALRCVGVARSVYLCCDRLELSPTPGRPSLQKQLIELIRSGQVEYLANRKVTGLKGQRATLSGPGNRTQVLEIDFLLSQPGYEPDYSLFHRLGVALKGPHMAPVHDPETMETNVSGIYVSGAIALGSASPHRAIALGGKHNQRIATELQARIPQPTSAERPRAQSVTSRSWWPPRLPNWHATDVPALGVGS